MSIRSVRLLSAGLIVVLTTGGLATAVYADAPLQSSHYELIESTVGSNGFLQSSSPNYQVSLSAGDPAIGNTSSTNYQVEAGSKTTADPALTVTVNNSANFGTFSPSAAATATSTFSVVDYTSYGYSVLIVGNPPSYGGHVIAPMATTGTSTPGTEQFGINLVANTSPTTFGANPNHGQFGVGSAATNYNTANQFRYVSGETIASAPSSSGQTTYTISYIVNVDGLTPSGVYTSDQDIICIATY